MLLIFYTGAGDDVSKAVDSLDHAGGDSKTNTQ